MQLFEKLFALLREGTLPVMLPLVLTCLGIGILIVERMLYLYDMRWLLGVWWPPTRRYMHELQARLAMAFDRYLTRPSLATRQALLEACRYYRTPYSRFIADFLTHTRAQDPSTRSLELEQTALREEVAIERGMALLSTFAKVAPLLGLLGTVTGMIKTFSAMMVSSTSDPKALSSGISIALIATNVGLVVALPGVVGMSWLSRRGKTLQEEINLASMQLRSADSTGESGTEEGGTEDHAPDT